MGELLLVEEVNGEARVSSKVVAENVGVEHGSVVRLIKKHMVHIEEFGRVGFEIVPLETKGGTQSTNVYFLNEEQSTFLLSLMKNSEIVVHFKKNLVRAFYSLKKKVQGEIDLSTGNAISESVSIFESLSRVATLFGLQGNQALISANVATRRVTGVDLQATLGIELKADDNEQLLTATQIGKELNDISAIKVNLLLIEHDYQGKNEAGYFPLPRGKGYAIMLDSGKKHSDGSMIQQLKWKRSIVSELKSIINYQE